MSSTTKALGRKTRCHYADRKSHKTTESDWLQGGLINVTPGKTYSLIQYQIVQIFNLGRWMAWIVSNKKRHYL